MSLYLIMRNNPTVFMLCKTHYNVTSLNISTSNNYFMKLASDENLFSVFVIPSI